MSVVCPATGARRLPPSLGDREKAVTLLADASAQGSVEEFLASQGLFRGLSLHSDFYFQLLHDYARFQELVRPKR